MKLATLRRIEVRLHTSASIKEDSYPNPETILFRVLYIIKHQCLRTLVRFPESSLNNIWGIKIYENESDLRSHSIIFLNAHYIATAL